MAEMYLNRPQFAAELEKCLECAAKPCMKACPVKCSPHDFIAAAKNGKMAEAAELIAKQNPLGETCGLICPEKFCMKACLRQFIDAPIKIPQVQAKIMQNARENNLLAAKKVASNGKKAAVIGLGPSGIGAISELLKLGFEVTAFEKADIAGGALNLISETRLPHKVLAYEWQKLRQNPLLTVNFNSKIENYEALLNQGFAAVIVAEGQQKKRELRVAGEELATDYVTYLRNRQKYATTGDVIVVGGGAVAVDCALSAAEFGAKNVTMMVRRRWNDMKISAQMREELWQNQINVESLIRIARLEKSGDKIAVYAQKTELNADGKSVDVANGEFFHGSADLVILALGATAEKEINTAENIYYVGDFANGATTGVEAIASGKAAAAEIAQKFGM